MPGVASPGRGALPAPGAPALIRNEAALAGWEAERLPGCASRHEAWLPFSELPAQSRKT